LAIFRTQLDAKNAGPKTDVFRLAMLELTCSSSCGGCPPVNVHQRSKPKLVMCREASSTTPYLILQQCGCYMRTVYKDQNMIFSTHRITVSIHTLLTMCK